MTINILAHDAASYADSLNSAAVTLDTTGATFLLAAVMHIQSVTPTTVTVDDSEGNTWQTLFTQNIQGQSSNAKLTVLYCEAPTVNAAHGFSAVRLTGTGTIYPGIYVVAVDGQGVQIGNYSAAAQLLTASETTTCTSPAVSVTNTNELLLAIFGPTNGNSTTHTWAAPFTELDTISRDGSYNSGSIAYRAVSSNGSYTASCDIYSTAIHSTKAIIALYEAGDIDPDPIVFNDEPGASTNTEYTSNAVTLTGFEGTLSFAVTGGTVQKNGGGAFSSSQTVSPGDTVRLRRTSSGSTGTAVTVSWTCGLDSGVWTITTAGPTPDDEAVNFGTGNTNRYYNYATGANFDFPAATDWCFAFWFRIDSWGSNPYAYIFSIGQYDNNGFFQIGVGNASAGDGLASKLFAVGRDSDGTLIGADLPQGGSYKYFVSASSIALGTDYLGVVQRRGDNAEIYLVPRGTTGVAVDKSWNANSGGYGARAHTTAAQIGARGDLVGSRAYQGVLGEFGMLLGDSLSAADVEVLAEGYHLKDLRPTRKLDLRFRAINATEADQSGNGYDFTRMNGTGLALAREFFPNEAAYPTNDPNGGAGLFALALF